MFIANIIISQNIMQIFQLSFINNLSTGYQQITTVGLKPFLDAEITLGFTVYFKYPTNKFSIIAHEKKSYIYLCDIKFNPTIDKINVDSKSIFINETGSFNIRIPASTVKTAPKPAHTAYPTLTFTPLSMAL